MVIKMLNTILTVRGRYRRRPRPLLGPQQDRRAAARAAGRTGSSRTSTSCPAFAAIALYLDLPGDPDHRLQLRQRDSSSQWVGLRELHDAVDHPTSSSRRCSTRCCGSSSCPLARSCSACSSRRSPTGSGPAARRPPRPSSSCRWRSAWSARRRSGGSSTRTTRPASRRSACRTPSSPQLGYDPVAWLQTEHVPPQQPAADGHPALGAGRLLDGAALGRDQGRARGDTWRRPASTAPTSGRSSSGSWSRRSAARSSRSSSP